MVQWVKNLIAVARIMQRCRFNPWPENFHMLQVWPSKKKKKKKEKKEVNDVRGMECPASNKYSARGSCGGGGYVLPFFGNHIY